MLPGEKSLIRPATPDDFAALQMIERAAFETLRAAGGIGGVATASSTEMLSAYLRSGLLFVACTLQDAPIGFCGGLVAEGLLHVCELDVHPDWQGKGIGRKLLETMLAAGRSSHLLGASLTTDRLAPFNAPFYGSLGFEIVDGPDCPPRLKAILDEEIRHGLDPGRRVAMVLFFRTETNTGIVQQSRMGAETAVLDLTINPPASE
jgi:predicted N-acetyltransferase YhbS